MQIGLTQEIFDSLIEEELTSAGRYTFTVPGGRPVFTKDQRAAISRAISAVVRRNNEEVLRALRNAGIRILA
jgi:hypothetical protein